MADDDAVRSDGNAANTTYTMALQMWRRTHDSDPGADDREFLKLVSSCARAVQGLRPFPTVKREKV